MDNLLGFLVYIDLGNGCLASKFGNTAVGSLFTEAAVQIPDPNPGASPDDIKGKFIGKYLVTWIEGPEKTVTAHLIIKQDGESTARFKLIWQDLKDPTNILYFGQGMRYGDLLVASYWSPAIQGLINPRDPGGSKF